MRTFRANVVNNALTKLKKLQLCRLAADGAGVFFERAKDVVEF
ncbi:hypothetical protein [Mesorhizobium sp. M0012]